jgi:5-methylcytosine-specific restriction endonuclease McrA
MGDYVRKKHGERLKKRYDEGTLVNALKGKKLSEETKKKISKNLSGIKNPNYKKKLSKETRKRMSEGKKLRISTIKKKYKFFSKLEHMRYNPNKPGKREIQIHCKNHLCENSKEKDGWFTPTYIQFYERVRQLEREQGNEGSYFYCSEKCKEECPLYNSFGGDPFKKIKKSYTESEYKIFRIFVLERDNYICQYCEDVAVHVHHERPQKLEPFFALDPDFAWSCCEKCHYKKGHKDECSSAQLSKIICNNYEVTNYETTI